jgi:hypothetical protein
MTDRREEGTLVGAWFDSVFKELSGPDEQGGRTESRGCRAKYEARLMLAE